MYDESPMHKELPEGSRSKGGGGRLRAKHPSPEHAEVASHDQTDEPTVFPLPGLGTTQPRGFPTAWSKKGSLKLLSLWGKHIVDVKRVVA